MFLAPGIKLTDEEKRRRSAERKKNEKINKQRIDQVLREIESREAEKDD